MAGAPSALAGQCSAITTNNITFNFEGSHTCGQFVTGDWWVIDGGNGVRLNNMSPSSTSTNHGWDVNPCIIGSGNCKQPYDDRKIGDFGRDRQPSLPYTASGGDSIVKCRSFNPGGSCIADHHKGCCEDMAIVSVLDEAPPSDAFRPPYVGTSKPILRASQVDFDVLPDLTFQYAKEPSWEEVRRVFGGPWIDHMKGAKSRFIHPRNNMRRPNNEPADYGADLSIAITKAVMKTLRDYPDSEKAETVYGITQYGIDLYHMLLIGQEFKARGGHGGGRKLPILYAGLVLNHPGMLNIGQTHGLIGTCGQVGTANFFQEDDHTYFGSGGVALWGESGGDCDASSSNKYGGNPQYDKYLSGCNKGNKNRRDPDGQVDGGNKENKIVAGNRTDLSQCSPNPTPASQISSNVGYAGAYQWCCTTGADSGVGIAARLLGLRDEWNWEPFFKYLDRWSKPPYDNSQGHYGSSWYRNMFDKYNSCADDCSCGGQACDAVHSGGGDPDGGGDTGGDPNMPTPSAPILLD